MNKEEPVSVTIGVDLIEHKMSMTGQDKAPQQLEIKEPCPECGATTGFQVAMRADNKEMWVFCMNCGVPIVSLLKLSEALNQGEETKE